MPRSQLPKQNALISLDCVLFPIGTLFAVMFSTPSLFINATYSSISRTTVWYRG